ncbi:MAG: OmpH family outer membrane protein [Acidobacteriia bacterium]|nr:OmpH family outer membrane protein [Terriglobia bacterium]
MRRIASLFIVLAVAAAGTAWAQAIAPARIGVFDAQRVSEETAEGKRVQSKLTAFSDKKRAEISAKEKDVQELQDKLNSQALSLSAEKRSSMEKDLQKKILDLNQGKEGAQREMQLEVSDAEGAFREKLLAAVESFGRDEGFAIILERGAAIYVHPSSDVTTAIVDRFNKLFPVAPEAPASKDGAKPAAPSAAPPAAPPTVPDKK